MPHKDNHEGPTQRSMAAGPLSKVPRRCLACSTPEHLFPKANVHALAHLTILLSLLSLQSRLILS